MQWEDEIDLVAYTNLDSRPDRNEFIRNQLEREGIVAHRIAGVDARLGIPGQMPCKVMRKKHNIPWYQCKDNTGFLGALYAFGMSLFLAKMSGAKNLLFLEDDAVLPLGTKDIILKELESAPESWDVLNFGSITNQAKTLVPVNDRWASSNAQVMTHCILVNQRAFSILIEACSMQPSRGTVDSVINMLPTLRYFMTTQTFFPQLSDISDTTREKLTCPHRSMDGLTDGKRPIKG